MTKIKVTNYNLKILQFLLDEGMLSANYLAITTDICLRQARTNLEKEMNIHISQSTFNKAIVDEVI